MPNIIQAMWTAACEGQSPPQSQRRKQLGAGTVGEIRQPMPQLPGGGENRRLAGVYSPSKAGSESSAVHCAYEPGKGSSRAGYAFSVLRKMPQGVSGFASSVPQVPSERQASGHYRIAWGPQ